jgi:hypothetical protein
MMCRGLFAKEWRSKLPVAALSLGMLVLSAGKVSAQEKQGPYIAQASQRLIKLIDKANGEGYKLQDNKLSIGGGWMKQGNENWVTLYTIGLEKGTAYRILAAGDGDAQDVDVQIVDANGKTVAADTKNDPDAVVDFTPTVSQQYQVRIRLYASRENLPCVCLGIVMSK